jgi:electron transfer flavoprotein beta subunit
MGADRGILINDGEPYRVDTHTTAAVLAAALKQIPYDLVFTGARSVDYDNFQTGSAVAQILDIPQITQVVELEMGDQSLTCSQITEWGQFKRTCPMPALITTQRGLNDPRYPSLPGIMKAKKKPLEIKELTDMGIDEPLAVNARMLSLEFPKPRKAAQMIQEETIKESAARLIHILHNEVKAI